jgi:hypothetical protein
MLATSLRIAFTKIPKRYTRLSSLVIENKAGAPEASTTNCLNGTNAPILHLPLSFSPGGCTRKEDFMVTLTINKDDP